jgi:hypothetical protein
MALLKELRGAITVADCAAKHAVGRTIVWYRVRTGSLRSISNQTARACAAAVLRRYGGEYVGTERISLATRNAAIARGLGLPKPSLWSLCCRHQIRDCTLDKIAIPLLFRGKIMSPRSMRVTEANCDGRYGR